MLITTTDVLQDIKIEKYIGLIACRIPMGRVASSINPQKTYAKSTENYMQTITSVLE